MEFKAFISYKHVKSTAFSYDIEFHIKKYAKGPLQKPDKIFRDEQYLEVGGDLSELIKNALRKSEFLILLASPEAAQSPWVIEELRIWCAELKRADKIIIILTSGRISVDGNRKEINWEETNALPPFLKTHLPILPLFVDLTWAINTEYRNLSNQDYKKAINSIVAKLRGLTPNALNGIEWKVRRRNLRIAWSLSLVLVLLLVILTIGYFRLDRINAELITSINVATSRELAAKSQLQELPDRLNSASRAVDININNESINSLLTILSNNQSLVHHILQSSEAIQCLGSISGSNKLYTLVKNQLLIFNNLGIEVKKVQLPKNITFKDIIYYSPDKIFAVSSTEIWDIQAGKPLVTFSNNLISASAPEVFNNQIFIGMVNGSVFSINFLNGEKRELYTHRGAVTDLSVGDTFVISTALSRESPVVYYSFPQKKRIEPKETLFAANAVDISTDNLSVVFAFENGEVGLFSLPDFNMVWMETMKYSASAVSIQPNGHQIAAGSSSGEMAVFNFEGSTTDSWQALNGGVWRITWIQDIVFSGGSDGWIRSWKPNQFLVPSNMYPSVERFFWDDKKLMAIDGNRIYDLYSSKKVVTIADWSSDEIMDINSNGIVSKYKNKPCFYDASYNKKIFPEETDKLRVVSSLVSIDGNFVVSTWWPDQDSSGHIKGGISVWNTSSNTVEWLESIPNFPRSISLYKNNLIAVSGSESVYIWDFNTFELISKGEGNLYEPINNLAYLNSDKLLLGHLRGKISIVSVKNVDSTLYISTIPVGSNYGLEILSDGTLLSTDVDGVRWFDSELNYLGTIINTSGHRSFPSQIRSSPSQECVIGIRLRSGEVTTIKLDIAYFSRIAKLKGKARYFIND